MSGRGIPLHPTGRGPSHRVSLQCFLAGLRLFVQQIPGTVFFVDDVGCMITPEFVLHLATLIDVSERQGAQSQFWGEIFSGFFGLHF